MAWIESHQDIETHPKTLDLMTFMGWELDMAVSKLHRFWWWCLRYAEDGDLRKHNDDRLARAVALNGGDEAKRFVEAMVKARWLDREPYFRVHNWWKYAGRLLQIRYKHDPEKWRKVRALYSGDLDDNPPKNGSKGDTTKPDLTNQDQPNQTKTTHTVGAVFEELWEAYPVKDGKKSALRHFQASVKTPEDVERIRRALKNYLGSDKVKRGFVKNGHTWFNNWQDWENYVEKGGQNGTARELGQAEHKPGKYSHLAD
jgi:hypothetical protein